jgi:hypothetical protein
MPIQSNKLFKLSLYSTPLGLIYQGGEAINKKNKLVSLIERSSIGKKCYAYLSESHSWRLYLKISLG